MKGKTNAPLTILVDTELLSHPRIKALAEKGHSISNLSVDPIDLVLSVHAWRWDEKYVDMAIKAARKLKKEAK